MTAQSTIARVMTLLDREYPGKFSASPERMRVWAELLDGYPSDVVLAAALHLVSISEWPPTVAQIRRQAYLLSRGDIVAQTGAEAWERVRRKMGNEPDLELTPLEKRVLDQTSSLYDLRRSTTPGIDRAHYIRAYDETAEKELTEAVTLPQVLRVAEMYRPRELAEHATTDERALTPGTEAEEPKERPKVRRCVCGAYVIEGEACRECEEE